MLGTNDTKAAKRVAQREWHDGFDHRMSDEFFRARQWNISRRHIDLINAGEYELQRAAFGAHHHIDTT